MRAKDDIIQENIRRNIIHSMHELNHNINPMCTSLWITNPSRNYDNIKHGGIRHANTNLQ